MGVFNQKLRGVTKNVCRNSALTLQCGEGQTFEALTTSQEGEVPPLVKFLENAGLTVNKLLLLDVGIAADSSNDTLLGSV